MNTEDKKMITISASIMASDFCNLSETIKKLAVAEIKWIHCDIMDFHFVPNLTFGPHICKDLKNFCKTNNIDIKFDIHLMVDNPIPYIDLCASAKMDLCTFHAETVDNPEYVIDKILSSGMKAGMAFNPETEITIDTAHLKKLSMVLIMLVHPGFSGQKMIKSCIPKIEKFKKTITDLHLNTFVAVDGGINLTNIKNIYNKGADFIVLGSGIFSASNYKSRIKDIYELLEQ